MMIIAVIYLRPTLCQKSHEIFCMHSLNYSSNSKAYKYIQLTLFYRFRNWVLMTINCWHEASSNHLAATYRKMYPERDHMESKRAETLRKMQKSDGIIKSPEQTMLKARSPFLITPIIYVNVRKVWHTLVWLGVLYHTIKWGLLGMVGHSQHPWDVSLTDDILCPLLNKFRMSLK